jgi:hypothetical protein
MLKKKNYKIFSDRTSYIESANSKKIIFYHNILNSFQKLFQSKGILIVNKSIRHTTSTTRVLLSVYFENKKLLKFNTKKKLKLLSRKFYSFLPTLNQKILTESNFLSIKFINVGRNINKLLLRFYHLKLKKELNIIFLKNINLYVDFLKLLVMYLTNKAGISVFLTLILKIFRPLSKRAHGRFFKFLKTVFNMMTDLKDARFNTCSLMGLKLVINGKLKGKARASSMLIKSGSLPLQTLNKPIEHVCATSFTSMGTFGFKLWATKLQK